MLSWLSWNTKVMPQINIKLITGFADTEPPVYYYTTNGTGVQMVSLQSSNVSTVVSSKENLRGIAYDTMRRKLYWSSGNYIYRCDATTGTNVETALSTSQCKFWNHLDVKVIGDHTSQQWMQTGLSWVWLLTGLPGTSTLWQPTGTYWRVMVQSEEISAVWLCSLAKGNFKE